MPTSEQIILEENENVIIIIPREKPVKPKIWDPYSCED